MPDSNLKQSPLIEHSIPRPNPKAPEAVVTIAEQAFLGHLNLRGDVSEDVSAVFGLNLPTRANSMSREGTAIALWLGPDEWLLIHSSEDDLDRVEELKQRTAQRHASVIDVSSGQTVIHLSGPGARDVLARGCPLDLHPRVFKPGDCAQTHYEHIGITLWLDTSAANSDEVPWINLVVRRSFADYLYALLDESAASVRAAV